VEKFILSRELYLAILLDRTASSPVMIMSPIGGMGIEELAVSHPDKVFYFPIPIDSGMTDSLAQEIAHKMEVEG
jgi:succinyl-CoA synthetase beta subunit